MATLTQVIDQMQGSGLPMLPSGHPVLDGKVHRFGPKKKAWYLLREVGSTSGSSVVAGAFGVWRGADNNAVPVKMDWTGISPEERAAAERRQKEAEAREAQKRERFARFAATRARMQWEAGRLPDEAGNAYLTRKQITPERVRVAEDGTLLVPMYQYQTDGARMVGLQKIHGDGSGEAGKRFNKGMEKIGAALLLGSIEQDTSLALIAEGYATARTIRMALNGDRPVMVGFDAGNLLAVAQGVRRDFPDLHLLFAADDDWQLERRLRTLLADDFGVSGWELLDGESQILRTEDGKTVDVTTWWRQDVNGVAYLEADIRTDRQHRTLKFENAGIARATAAARAVGNASVIIPRFTDRGDNKWTDFNDLHMVQQLDDVAQQIADAIQATTAPPSAKSAPALSLVKTPPPSARSTPAGEEGSKEAAAPAGKSRKPKKEYPKSHWDTVDYLLSNFVLIYGDDTAWDSVNRIIIKIAHMRLAYGSDAVKFWLNNPDRRMVNREDVVFDPTCRADPATTVNLFHGFEMVSKKGACDKIIALLTHLCDGNAEVLAWVLRWLAYPLQHQGAKMRTSIIVHGDEGSGKNLFFENVIKRIYGEYGGVIGNAQIEAAFNEWASRKLYMVADEVVTRNELRQLKGKLKHMVTGEVIMINPKGMTERAEANHMNFVFLSNELQPLALDKTDRRYLVLWTPPKLEESFYREVSRQIESGGVEAFYHYLLHDVPLGDFTEHTKPIPTEAKSRLISLGLSAPERFYREWAGGFLPLPFICCSAMQLYLGYCRWSHLNGERFPVTQTMFGRSVERAGRDQIGRAVIKYDLESDVKQRTVYLVGEQPTGTERKDWVEGASDLFEKHLKKYRHVYDQPTE